ncbi:hypothetical protein CAPTEDRAFT_210916 [Capitella teleta]|uniref:Farnesoic acid O-methyl transferase domain-containing protein n=1 Tax=Capitella teleta TaxID=283909 RepID=R7VDR9_CAPTE|nr:hypothetical protein CAPTEDRAFT_210916 [Capitella teleta]|eukprot:ELU14461.1 hypothetical protein CAPTEDRAFT_210916 [Capitella teleta]
MKIFAFLILVLIADFAMGDDIYMCFAKNVSFGGSHVKTEFVDADDFYIGLKACGEPRTLLIFPNYLDSIELAFKNPDTNTFQLIKYYGKEVLVETGEVVLDCNEMKYFWLNKANGTLTIGRGLQSGTDTLTTYPNPLTDGFDWSGVFFANVGGDAAEFEKQCGRLCLRPE